jgi:hypothetical protein
MLDTRFNFKPGDLVEIPAYSEEDNEYQMKGMILNRDSGSLRDKLGNIHPEYYYKVLLQNGRVLWLDEDMVFPIEAE